ncbi:phosphoglycerate kinase [Alphaproteobacteria bacterium]|nr:phosphoglycerate kinase [Alphaproteobacteria bacterium]
MIVFPRKTVRDIDVRGKIVLVRTDYNIPIDGDKIGDDNRIMASLPTLKYLAKNGARIVVISHLGRPGGQIDPKYSLEPVAKQLGELWDGKVKFVPDCIGDKVRVAVKSLSVGEILLCENLRFHRGEEADDVDFARQLVKSIGARYFVQDGFGVLHRAHASTSAITDFVPSVAGLLVEREWLEIENTIKNPNRPLVAVIGGAKIVDKTPLIAKFIDLADTVIIGGAIANNFLAAEDWPVGASLWDPDMDGEVNKIFIHARKVYGREFKQKFILPIDVAVSKNGNPGGARTVVSRSKVEPNNAILDIGTKTINHYTEIIERAGTVIWNGTLGVAEKPNFAHGSSRLALALADNPQIYSLIGGGDTVDFVRNWDTLNGASFSHLSTGGGAALSLMAGEGLPGIDSLLAS